MLIRLKKYLNPHENGCSKVISILTTGNILLESSSAPWQHKSVQYKWFTLYLHRDVLHTDMLQLHFNSCRGVSGAGDNMCESRNFGQSYLVLSLFYSSIALLLRKLYLYFTKDPDGVHYFPGGCQTFSRGVQMLISLETHVRTCYFPGGVSGPPIPLWICTWAMSS